MLFFLIGGFADKLFIRSEVEKLKDSATDDVEPTDPIQLSTLKRKPAETRSAKVIQTKITQACTSVTVQKPKAKEYKGIEIVKAPSPEGTGKTSVGT